MICLHTSVIMLHSLILCCILVIFPHYFPLTMSNSVLLCHTLFRLSPLIWHALPSNFSVACFHWCNDFEEFYHTIISAAWSHNYFPPLQFWLDSCNFFSSPYLICIHICLWMIWIFLFFFCVLWSVLTNFVRFWCSEHLDVVYFLSGLNVFIFKVWGKQKYKHQTYI